MIVKTKLRHCRYLLNLPKKTTYAILVGKFGLEVKNANKIAGVFA